MYQALYRKYRPRVFEDVVGLPHVTDTLRTEVKNGRIAHAYLFTGSRGTGKTTCARILAKAINCLDPKDGDPCGCCEACKKIDGGLSMDVTEIDAASNNGVDSIRDLREEAAFTPAELKARVYIIDEVHMLSQAAFNALLKTLEEPPEHVYFILATTEVQKIPETILSRCQRFDFHRIPNDAISARLKYIAAAEKMELTDEAADMIARICDGGMRDAVSLLDQCGSQGKITAEGVARCAGLASKQYLMQLAEMIAKHDTAGAIGLIDSLYSDSCDMEQLCRELILTYRDMMILRVSGNDGSVKADPAALGKTKELAALYTVEEIIAVLDRLQTARERMKYSSDRLADMEIAAVRLCEPSLNDGASALAARISRLEKAVASLGSGGAVMRQIPDSDTAEPTGAADKRSGNVNTDDTKKNADVRKEQTSGGRAEKKVQGSSPKPMLKWAEIMAELIKINPVAAGFMQGAKAVRDGDRIIVSGVIDYVKDDFAKGGGMKEALEKAAATVLGEKVSAAADTGGKNPGKPAEPAPDPFEDILSRAREEGIPIEEE